VPMDELGFHGNSFCQAGVERPGGDPIVRPYGSARIRQVPERLPEIRAAHRHSSRCVAG
jgi:hypothetical protein